MGAKDLYLYALDKATEVVVHVKPEQMGFPTPDAEWDVRDLLHHIVYELAWTGDIVAGRTIGEVGDKHENILINGNPVELWRHYREIIRERIGTCDVDAVAHLSYIDTTVGQYLVEAGNDQLIHAWDLGQALGQQVQFDDDVADVLYRQVLERQEEYAKSGLFGTPISVPSSASIQTKLLALLGRSADWSPARV